MAFASLIASSSVSNTKRGARGPNVSSDATCISGVTLASTVGSKKNPFCAGLRPPQSNVAPLIKASWTCCATLPTGARLTSGLCCGRIEAGAQFQDLNTLDKFPGEHAENASLYQNSVCTVLTAILPAIASQEAAYQTQVCQCNGTCKA